MSEEGYKPTEEDIEKAEQMMTPEQEAMRGNREKEVRQMLSNIDTAIDKLNQNIQIAEFGASFSGALYGQEGGEAKRLNAGVEEYRKMVKELLHWKKLLEEGSE